MENDAHVFTVVIMNRLQMIIESTPIRSWREGAELNVDE
jgi:hypothetical protein